MAIMINWLVLLDSTGQRPSQSAEQRAVDTYVPLQITKLYSHLASSFLWSHSTYERFPIRVWCIQMRPWSQDPLQSAVPVLYLPFLKKWSLVCGLNSSNCWDSICFSFLFQFRSWFCHRFFHMNLGYSFNIFLPQFIFTRRRLHHFPSLTFLSCQDQRVSWALIFSTSWHTFSSESTIISAMACTTMLH